MSMDERRRPQRPAANDDTLTRRDVLSGAMAAGAAIMLPGFYAPGLIAEGTTPTGGSGRHLNADEALDRLLKGNHRFAIGKPLGPRRSPKEFQALASGQSPEAIIVSCADSRVAPEILFDVGLGDIFVVRVAGNVIDGAGVTVQGTIEYGVGELNVPLVLVLGHSGCGAVAAAIQHFNDMESLPGAINGLVELIRPAVTRSKGLSGDPLENAIRANVEIGVHKLRGLEPILAPRVKDGKVKVVGGVYDLHTGKVRLIS